MPNTQTPVATSQSSHRSVVPAVDADVTVFLSKEFSLFNTRFGQQTSRVHRLIMG